MVRGRAALKMSKNSKEFQKGKDGNNWTSVKGKRVRKLGVKIFDCQGHSPTG